MSVADHILSELYSVVGAEGVLVDPEALDPFLREERGRYRGASSLVVRPSSVEQVSAIVRLCARHALSLVPQGGNTGLCAGAVSDAGQVILSLGRMNRIRSIDPVNFTMTVEAGVVLETIQKAALDADRFFPLSLGAQGSCQIGGNLATNAGGLNVLRYGNARDLCLGLEVVLADGRIWNGLKRLGKDNTGYALKHLFIGGEGTLGIITAAVLKLFPRPLEKQTALCAVSDVRSVPHLLALARSLSGDQVSAFELMARFSLELACRHLDSVTDPFESPWPWYVLVEFSTTRAETDLRTVFERFLEEAFEQALIGDAVIAESGRQDAAFWRMREGLPEAQKHEGASVKHDISVPIGSVPEFLERAMQAVSQAVPGIRPCPFGHVGDGNIHFNLTQPETMSSADFLAKWEDLNRIVHDIVADMGGSFSAEHGIGRLKVDEMLRYKADEEIDMMRRIKKALDPQHILNPGVILCSDRL
ncbi:FAD-binding oxidoreductase [Haematospirillum jordaniae]|uniref:Hydroxyacid dehydrogenase n=1 Tax=Haematospirillum jordaniae TaxID=1549855 RepID=A0A143DCP1_9PROT|nr:FAD-binding oxidoreductase [Haematospirillum jordaniae]AMW33888.1 hydroxyacid dehydrogenase [Haematospirillum jordaniae]NKD44467.1 FAD-binding oxidoreductase [Haematospirillum jordaniae]NKD57487.1 FAD-binding oxidoreductase [Haematospirillum jordaniae]NKD59535.1 FAD-binding oxidoreductase [Haematospirillum jordaniae]NKD67529.1 FAD-binding oxidoreductase [Haematospirillum jordaniae]